MAIFISLEEAVSEYVSDGSTVALEGFTHLIPFAAGHEIIRQQVRDLTLVRMTPDLLYDRMIGAGCVKKLVFSWGGNPGVGSLHRLRDSVENGWPNRIEIEEHTHAGLANRYVAGASGLPFAVMRGYSGTDLPAHTANVATVTCPFTGEVITAVAAMNPDVGVIHAQRADRRGNVQIWGISGVQREVVLASETSIVTVEEVVDELDPNMSAHVIPGMAVDVICHAPNGAKPSYAQGYYDRDNEAYLSWEAISRDRKEFTSWLKELRSGAVRVHS